MNRVLIGIRGEPTPEGMERMAEVQATGPAQVLVAYDPQSLTVMDLIRTIREEGFLAGML